MRCFGEANTVANCALAIRWKGAQMFAPERKVASRGEKGKGNTQVASAQLDERMEVHGRDEEHTTWCESSVRAKHTQRGQRGEGIILGHGSKERWNTVTGMLMKIRKRQAVSKQSGQDTKIKNGIEAKNITPDERGANH